MKIEDIETPFLDAIVRQRLVDDENLDDSKTKEALQHCQGADELQVESAFDYFAAANRLVGVQAVELSSVEWVGHIKRIDAITSYLSKRLNALSGAHSIYSTTEIEERIRALALPGAPLSKREALLWFEEEVFDQLPDCAVAGRPTWLFEADEGDARTLLGSSECSTLPCRLGLPEPLLWGHQPYEYPKGLEFVGFALAGSEFEGGKRPTALDGSYDSVKKIWIIGGRTQPLPHGPESAVALGGLREIVSEPPLLSRAVKNVYVFVN
ncbi:hypothetical protein [Rhodobacter lacus]|uniref:Uncharacterized protein n=1 Tax=Rhodobacter lacus TaxID=1641972 RepID=A0ABW5AB72_9RHOB